MVTYIRMSTDEQSYSLAAQSEVIRNYAEKHRFQIVDTYVDAGISGLTLTARDGLSRLLIDCLKSDRIFHTILVLDVSRWGRFQDPDQSAAYEFICRQAGVEVRYCAEEFENDGSFTSSLLKQFKRIMAAEYSRELSRKTFFAQAQQARLGFKQGGPAIYGVRRMLVDRTGNERGLLAFGDRKSLRSDKVVLVKGPAQELAVVRRVFTLFARSMYTRGRIASLLNKEAVPGYNGHKWTEKAVSVVLSNELMIGIYCYNRTTRRLKGAARTNPASELIKVRVFDPIVRAG